MNNSKRIYRAAIYVRLSKEDGDLDDVRKAESNSISNQKSLILNYLKDKEDIEIVSIREDDGYSGATFDRPAFKLMMQDVKDGIIDCIVVKDLSRFAREYIDAGRYIERMFPAMGIRFIAINDAYDSADTQAQGNEIIIRVMFIGTQVDTMSCKGADSVCCPLLAFFLCFFIMREARIPHSGAAQCAAAPRPAPFRCPPCQCRGIRCGCSGGSCGSISPSARPPRSAG